MTETSKQASQDAPETPTVVIGEKTEHPQEVALPVPVSRPEKRLLLIDGHSLAFRAFFALSRAAEYGNGPGFVTSDGVHTEGVYGFVNTMVKLVREEKPTHLVVSFDLEGPTLRSQEYGEYKGGRDETPEEFHGQVPNIQRILEALGVPIVTMEGYEADDVLATLATMAAGEDFEVLVFSGDRDAFQMITDHVTVVYPGRTPSDLRRMDAAAVYEKYKVAPQNYPDLAALTGETADNLPGVPGVGPGFAAKWITAYGPVDSLLERRRVLTGGALEMDRIFYDRVVRGYAVQANQPATALAWYYRLSKRGYLVEPNTRAELLRALLAHGLRDDARSLVRDARSRLEERHGHPSATTGAGGGGDDNEPNMDDDEADRVYWRNNFWTMAEDFGLIEHETKPEDGGAHADGRARGEGSP